MDNFPQIQIPGPGAAMAIAAAVSIYSTAKVAASCLSEWTHWFLVLTFMFIIATLIIEWIHKPQKEKRELRKK